MYAARRMERLAPSGIRRVNEQATAMERAGKSVIHFEMGRPDFDTPQYIKDACLDSLRAGDVFYTSNYGTLPLRQAIADKLYKQNRVSYQPEEILVTVGLAEGIFDAICATLNAGDEILVPDPSWINYVNVPMLFDVVPVPYGLREENGFQPDPQELRQKVTGKTKALVLMTPNNPTGSVLPQSILESIAEIAIENDLLVFSDEIYERLLYDGNQHVSMASLPGMKERTITMNGFSKAYSMTGWRLGYVAAPRPCIELMNTVHQHNTACAPSFVQSAAVCALRNETTEVAGMVEEYQRRRDYAVKAINAIPGLRCMPPQGAFYIFVNATALSRPSAELAKVLLDQGQVALIPGSVFGPGGEGYLRMSFANSFENIVEGCRRMALCLGLNE